MLLYFFTCLHCFSNWFSLCSIPAVKLICFPLVFSMTFFYLALLFFVFGACGAFLIYFCFSMAFISFSLFLLLIVNILHGLSKHYNVVSPCDGMTQPVRIDFVCFLITFLNYFSGGPDRPDYSCSDLSHRRPPDLTCPWPPPPPRAPDPPE